MPASRRRAVKGEAGELAALVGVEDLRRAIRGQGLIQRVRAEARVQRVRQPPSQHVAARPVHDRHQVEEAAPHRDVGDVGAPDMVRPLDPQIPQQIRVNPVLGVRRAGPRRPDRPPEDPEGASGEPPGGARSAPPRGADAVPSGGRRRTDTSGTARRSDASAPASPRSRPSARSRATSARSTAAGIAGSGSAPDGRAQPAPASRPGSTTGPA